MASDRMPGRSLPSTVLNTMSLKRVTLLTEKKIPALSVGGLADRDRAAAKGSADDGPRRPGGGHGVR